MCLFCRETNAAIYRQELEIQRIKREIQTLKDRKKVCICADRTAYYRRHYLKNRDKKIQAAKDRYYRNRSSNAENISNVGE